MNRMTPLALRATALVSAVALVACSSDDPMDPVIGIPAGTFTATVTGDVTASFSGAAVQGEAAGPLDWQGWLLVLGDSTSGNNAVFVSYLGARPPNGTYQLIDIAGTAVWDEDGEWIGALVLGGGTNFSYIGATGSGTVTITSSSADLVEGTYDFQVTDGGFLGNPPMLATVTGSFSAVGGAVEIPF